MARRIDWSTIQSNQTKLTGQILDDSGNKVDLTGLTLSLVIKATQTSTDVSGVTYTPTITSATLGTWSLTIAGTAFATPGTAWYRLDVIDASANHTTANLGSVTTVAA